MRMHILKKPLKKSFKPLMHGLLGSLLLLSIAHATAAPISTTLNVQAVVDTASIEMTTLPPDISFNSITNPGSYSDSKMEPFTISWSNDDSDTLPITVSMTSEFTINAAAYPGQFCLGTVCNTGPMAVLSYSGTHPNDGHPNRWNIPLQVIYATCGRESGGVQAWNFFDAVDQHYSPHTFNYYNGNSPSSCTGTAGGFDGCAFGHTTCGFNDDPAYQNNGGELDFYLYPDFTSGGDLQAGDYSDQISITAEEA